MSSENTNSAAPLLGDNLALDFINTEYVVDGKRHDCFIDDQRVAGWLISVGLLPDIKDQQIPDGLLIEARELRDTARNVVNAAMNSVPVDLAVINRVLEVGRPISKLEWDGNMQQYRVAVYQNTESPSGLLWPIADALVKLVTSDKFEYVRQCEAHDCILLFHDLSKSHRRRWCSMASCGNRMKVAAFRSRKKT
ncbi:ABATE domain-containing protein [Enterobacter cloacae]|uniref:CGNR zinc finger domain-containing protein n=1 Tax=Enterobacter cloacae TaxID=550 RepID=UPI0015FBA92F|nr:ABATE domain-containing protein [Enterobacter cloacae]MBA7852197.1 ABATE domain-containing protein [Enterobacter cloacae]MCU6227309.1 ABATE domain-containing protein [Enterobacter cloacae]